MTGPVQVGMILQQTRQTPRAKTLPFNGQDLPNKEIAELMKEAADSAAAAQTAERSVTSSKNQVDQDAAQVALDKQATATSAQNAATSAQNASTSETNAYDHEIAAATAAIQTAMYLVAPMYLTEPLGRADAISRGAPTFMVQGNGTTVAAYEYRVVDANTPATLIAQYAPSTSLGTEVEDTAANIASATSAINTVNKFNGKKVWDTTNKRLMRSSGSAPTSPWNVMDGSGTITPV